MIPKMIATDLDGTLLRNDRTVSERTVRALGDATAAGAEVVFVTARPPRFVDAIAARSQLTGTAVCSNGALVYDVGTGSVLRSRALPAEEARKVAEALSEAVGGVGFAVETGHKVVFAPGYGHRLPEDAESEFPVGSVNDLWALDAPFVKLLVWSAEMNADALLGTAENAAGGKAQFTHSGGSGLLEVSAAGVTKAGTLSALCAERGIDASDVIAFGDMPNDLTILEWAGTGYAMGNAHPQVLSAVSHHTLSNDEDGVAAVLEKLIAAA
ncbi:Cof-type HAD-IIB family hydrolase [Streptomyces sp. NBC_00046]|uniref:Cof-type HAD-IIB family hydrolase n=1 Tax=unclassified Streptomyces TaxID=2593676 RepID=UPI0032454FF0